MHRNKLVFLMVIILLALVMAACGDDDTSNNNSNDTVDPTPTAESLSNPAGLDTGLDMTGPSVGGNSGGDDADHENGGIGANLPGCDDLESDECPVPLDPSLIPLDGEASSGGITVAYASRYFDATTSEDGVLITVTPSERNKFEFKGTFEIYFAQSLDDALADLDDLPGEADTAAWSTDTLTGTISVVNDDTQDPPITAAIGAFTQLDAPEDDRVIVLKATTTGTFGWYFHTKLYEAMLESVVIVAAE